MKTTLLTILFIFVVMAAYSQDMKRQTAHRFNKEITIEIDLDYLLYLPDGYNENDELPLMIFLHGAGERGSDISKVKVHGPPKIVETDDMPFIILSPQCPADQWWNIRDLDYLLEEILKNYNIDQDRIYLTGLSMGGFGTWAWAAEHPEKFAAIAPICGGGDPRLAGALVDIPAWVFHGAKDKVVPITGSSEMVDALKELGADIKFTIYPEAGHDSWTETYANPDLYEWFLSHQKK